MTTYLEKPANVKEQWHLVNAEGKTLGRLAAKVAGILRGKHRPTFTPNVDMGDHVVIINAEKIHLTGNKMQDKLYIHHSGYPGGLNICSRRIRLNCWCGPLRECSPRIHSATVWQRNSASMSDRIIRIRLNILNLFLSSLLGPEGDQ
jgi:hypothetical protein